MKPYIISDQTTIKDISDMIQRAYDEGYADGYAQGKLSSSYTYTTPLTTPNPNITPYYTTVTCNANSAEND